MSEFCHNQLLSVISFIQVLVIGRFEGRIVSALVKSHSVESIGVYDTSEGAFDQSKVIIYFQNNGSITLVYFVKSIIRNILHFKFLFWNTYSLIKLFSIFIHRNYIICIIHISLNWLAIWDIIKSRISMMVLTFLRINKMSLMSSLFVHLGKVSEILFISINWS